MKKSTLITIAIALSAVAGALVAMFVYLRRRELELDEYEHILFNSDWNYEQGDTAELADLGE